MKKVTKLSYSFSLLFLFITGCVKKKTSQEQLPIQAEHSTLITPSPYVKRQASQNSETSGSIPEAGSSVPAMSTAALFQELQARFDDVSLPLGFCPEKCVLDDKGFYIGGTSSQPPEQNVRLCQQDMERFGWEDGMVRMAEPMLMVYTKPGRSCVYKIAPQEKSWFSKKDGAVIEVWFSITS